MPNQDIRQQTIQEDKTSKIKRNLERMREAREQEGMGEFFKMKAGDKTVLEFTGDFDAVPREFPEKGQNGEVVKDEKGNPKMVKRIRYEYQVIDYNNRDKGIQTWPISKNVSENIDEFLAEGFTVLRSIEKVQTWVPSTISYRYRLLLRSSKGYAESEGGVPKMTENNSEKIHEFSDPKNGAKMLPPSTSTLTPPKDIFSSKKHSMNYVTADGVKLRTGYDHKKDWYMLCLKELLDNAIDFLWSKYQGAEDAAIIVYIEITSKSLLRIKIRNTNPDNKEAPTLEDLNLIFDFDMTYGSKQNLHIISRGILGDAMKQVLTLPYVLIHAHDDGTTFANRQWEPPLIIRSNHKEFHIPLYVDLANQRIESKPIKEADLKVSFADTEIEVTLPIIDEIRSDLDIHAIEQFCKEYPIFTTDISFDFTLIDNSPDDISSEAPSSNTATSIPHSMKKFLASDLGKILGAPARKAAIEIKYPALHSITDDWNNKGSIHSYKPGEFTTFIESVYDKANTTVYERIQQLREGTNLKMDSDNRISIAELVADPNKAERIEKLFKQLRAIMNPPDKLSLPYTINNAQRKEALVKRISLVHKGRLDTKKASYRSVDGIYKDRNISFPYVFEIVAIPYNENSIDSGENWVRSEFKGSVNYSISPRGNRFEGEYRWEDPKKSSEFYRPWASSAFGILQVYNFYDYGRLESKAKLPCVIHANLITPRVDYFGADKSRIDTGPFTDAIIKACRKLAGDIQTFKAAGWEFYKHSGSTHTPEKVRKATIEDILTEMLDEWE